MELKTVIKGEGENLLVIIGESEIEEIAAQLPECTVLSVYGMDWDRDLSPWPAEKVFKRGNNFGGKADELIPEIEAVVARTKEAIHPKKTILAGYSLAGLFTLYMCTKTDLFDACAGVSSSMWYDGWMDYLKVHKPNVKEAVLSLGDQEKNTKNPRMATVQDRTEEAVQILRAYLPVEYHLNPGNHFNEPNKRIIRAVKCLVEENA